MADLLSLIRQMTPDDILGGVCIAILIGGLPWALPILTIAFGG